MQLRLQAVEMKAEADAAAATARAAVEGMSRKLAETQREAAMTVKAAEDEAALKVGQMQQRLHVG